MKEGSRTIRFLKKYIVLELLDNVINGRMKLKYTIIVFNLI